MNHSKKFKIGLIGYGFIGSGLTKYLNANPQLGIEVVFALDSKSSKIQGVFVNSLEEGLEREPDLVVEAATPEAYKEHILTVLKKVNFLGLSLSALADEYLHNEAIKIAETHHKKLYIPHGAVFGLDGLSSHSKDWKSVTVTTTKPPETLKLKDCDELTLVFEGSTREVCKLFPRSVNSHAAAALAGIGFDRQISKVYADPSLKITKQNIHAQADGFSITIDRESDLVGVSGIGMISSLTGSILRIAKHKGVITV
jgi:aspartate dehydrogenase